MLRTSAKWVKMLWALCLCLVLQDLPSLLHAPSARSPARYSHCPGLALASKVGMMGGEDSEAYLEEAEDEAEEESDTGTGSDTQRSSPGPLSAMEKLLGQSLYVWGDAEPDEQGNAQRAIYEMETAPLLEGKKYVALYFSASWCPPCRQFTPVLAKFYAAAARAKKGLEVIWVSGDRSQDEFVGYFQKMPWLAVPMDKAGAYMQSLGAQYKLKGIPHLVLLDAEGRVLSLDMRTQVLKDPHALQFPWRGPLPSLSGASQLLPSSIKSFFTKKLQELQSAILTMLRGALQAWLPASIVGRIFR